MSEDINISIPVEVINVFRSLYKTVDEVEWTQENNPPAYIAGFVNDDQEIMVYFRADGKLLKTKTSFSFEELPENVVNAFISKYPNHGIAEVWKTIMPDGEILYDLDVVREFFVQYTDNGMFTGEYEDPYE